LKTVIITGSTRGIGYGLAQSFLQADCQVVVSGRSPQAVEQAVSELTRAHPDGRILGLPCDVGDFSQVAQLWQAAQERCGQVDIWVNNAGIANSAVNFQHSDPQEMGQVVRTNLLGALYGSRVALAGMLAQGFGAIYTMEGLGSNGRQQKGLGIYGATKAGLHYFNRALALETAHTPVISGALQPGMVATEMITRQYTGRPEEWKRARPVLNILCDRVETVAPWLVQQMLANTRNGVIISWSNPWKLMLRFLTAPLHKRDVFFDLSI
jgi:NAD(P)-dependent dehydrogenase (short-subunit alcohol dehydrogenase family)